MLNKFIDQSMEWKVQLELENMESVVLPLYQVTQDIPLEADFPAKLQRLMKEEMHYLLGERIVGIFAPGGLNMSNKPLFLVISFISNDSNSLAGSLNHFLLAELGKKVKLVAATDPDLTPEQFKTFIHIITSKPEQVENLVIAYQKKE